MFAKLSTSQRPMVCTLWPCSFHESEIQVQGNQRFFSCLPLHSLFSSLRVSRSLSRGEKFPKTSLGPRYLLEWICIRWRWFRQQCTSIFSLIRGWLSHIRQPIFFWKVTRIFFTFRFFENNYFDLYILYKLGTGFIFVSFTRWWLYCDLY